MKWVHFIALLMLSACTPSGAQERLAGKIPIGKETTILLGPLTPEGYVDYGKAVNARLARGIRPDQNAMVLLVRALGPKPDKTPAPAEFFQLLQTPAPPPVSDNITEFFTFWRKKFPADAHDFDTMFGQLDAATGRPWMAKELPRVAEWLDGMEKQLTIVVEASGRPQYFHPLVVPQGKNGKKSSFLIGALTDYNFAIRWCQDALVATAMLKTAEGKTDAAWESLIACQRLARHMGSGASLLEMLVGFAGEAKAYEAILMFVSEAGLTNDQLRRCQADLLGAPRRHKLAEQLDQWGKFEKLDFLQSMHFSGMVEMLDPTDIFSAALGVLLRSESTERAKKQARVSIDWYLVFRGQAEASERLVRIFSLKERSQRIGELKKFRDEVHERAEAIYPVVKFLNDYLWWLPIEWIRKARSQGLLQYAIDMDLGGYLKIGELSDRCEQMERNLQWAFALARFRLAHRQYPAKLEELVPKYLDAVPIDLFSSKPMIYRRTEDGYSLYSVGINGKDDGGKTYGDKLGADDVRVRMPMPRKP